MQQRSTRSLLRAVLFLWNRKLPSPEPECQTFVFQECQRKTWKDGHFKACKKRNTVKPKRTQKTGQILQAQGQQNPDSESPNVIKDEKNEKSDSEEYEIITTTITKIALQEDLSFPVIDQNGKHLFSVSQKQINENKDFA